MTNSSSGRIDKKSVGVFWLVLIMCGLFGMDITHFQLPVVIFWLLLVFVDLILYFIKVPKGYVKETPIMEYLGLFGIINAVALSVFTAFCLGDTLFKFVLILVILSFLVIIVILIETKVFTVEFFEKNKNKKQGANKAIIFLAVLLGKFLPIKNEIVLFGVLMCLMILFFSFIYFFKLKAKWVVLSENQS